MCRQRQLCNLDNDDFGYHQITVERPLRLSFQVTTERIAALKEEGAFQKLAASKKKGKEAQNEIVEGQKLQQQVITMLGGMDFSTVDKSRAKFEARLMKSAEKADLKLYRLYREEGGFQVFPAVVRRHVLVEVYGSRCQGLSPLSQYWKFGGNLGCL